MNHSKYNPKYDPKNTVKNPDATAPVVQAPAVTPAVNAAPAQPALRLQTEIKSHDKVIAEPNHQDARSDFHDYLAATTTPAVITDKDSDATISNGDLPAAGHVVREPSALTGGLPELSAAQTDSESAEKMPGLSAKSGA